MAHTLFELGRYIAFIGIFFFVLFGIGLWAFRSALDRQGLRLDGDNEAEDMGTSLDGVQVGGARIGETVHYLRARDYERGVPELQRLGGSFRMPIVWTFYAGVWSFCLGLLLMSVTFGFVLLG